MPRPLVWRLPDLRESGPVVDVEFSTWPQLGVRPRKRIRGTAFIDTGADCTVIRPGLGSALGLSPTDQTEISTPGHPAGIMSNRYPVRVTFGRGLRGATAALHDVVAVELPLARDEDCLIGRDVLRKARFVYDGRRAVISLSFD